MTMNGEANPDRRRARFESPEAERDAALAAIERVRAIHPKHEVILCGAMAEVPHRHGGEREPYPIRPVTCTELQGHEGSHRDAACCWNFQRFDTHAAYKSAEWADRSLCAHCRTKWPCSTIAALDGAPEPEWEYRIVSDTGVVWEKGSTWEHVKQQFDSRTRYIGATIERRRKAGSWEPVGGEN